jgi:hypothetical protein
MSVRSVLALIGVLALSAVSFDGAAQRLEGSNLNGDVIRWRDGSEWKHVTVKGLEVVASDGTRDAVLEVADVPPGNTAGRFARWTSVSLRSSDPTVPDVTEPISAIKLYTPGYRGKAAPSLPAVTTAYDDLYYCPWQPAWDKNAIMPEQSVKANRNGKDILVQLSVTITHLVVEDGAPLCLVRAHRVNKGTVTDGWYSDIDRVVFSREAAIEK